MLVFWARREKNSKKPETIQWSLLSKEIRNGLTDTEFHPIEEISWLVSAKLVFRNDAPWRMTSRNSWSLEQAVNVADWHEAAVPLFKIMSAINRAADIEMSAFAYHKHIFKDWTESQIRSMNSLQSCRRYILILNLSAISHLFSKGVKAIVYHMKRETLAGLRHSNAKPTRPVPRL